VLRVGGRDAVFIWGENQGNGRSPGAGYERMKGGNVEEVPGQCLGPMMGEVDGEAPERGYREGRG